MTELWISPWIWPPLQQANIKVMVSCALSSSEMVFSQLLQLITLTTIPALTRLRMHFMAQEYHYSKTMLTTRNFKQEDTTTTRILHKFDSSDSKEERPSSPNDLPVIVVFLTQLSKTKRNGRNLHNGSYVKRSRVLMIRSLGLHSIPVHAHHVTLMSPSHHCFHSSLMTPSLWS